MATGADMIQTHWQPSYTPPGFARYEVPEHGAKMQSTRDRVLAYLEQNGMKSRTDILRELHITSAQLRHSVGLLKGLIEFEQTGMAKHRTCSYWALSNPPSTSQRGATHRVLEWYKRNPWSLPADIPAEIYPVTTSKHACVWMLELSGKLTSRVCNGKKQYKVAV